MRRNQTSVQQAANYIRQDREELANLNYGGYIELRNYVVQTQPVWYNNLDVPPAPTPPPLRSPIRNDAFPMCCGITIIDNFPTDTYTAMSMLTEIAESVRNMRDNNYTGMKLIALNHIQVGMYKEILDNLGFNEVAKAHHTGHGNDIHLFAYINHTPRHS